ncbi:thiolase family protein [Desertimonas flava]|jgi:acetyl-CoA acetyltransferase|uniref:thiolase family protein n=1 Tax=Desertimonas flava TaxID=2064846 RepID=UPI000E35762F|nr:thiolase family protein [Desertimonas flava]
MSIRGKVAVVGIGHTPQGELPGRSVEELSVDAIELALADAGLTLADVDGLIACKSVQGLGNDVAVGPLLGINPRYSQCLDYGTCNFSLHLAVQAIVTGMASTIVLCYGANARSAKVDFGAPVTRTTDLATASGLVHIAGPAALALQRHRHLYGTTDEQFGWLAVGQREWAAKNPNAIFRDPLTMDDYLAMPYLVEPLRRPDVTMISDGGVALVVTSADRAAGLRRTPAYVIGMAEQSGIRGDHTPDNLLRPWLRDAASSVWSATGLGPADIDVLYIQDPTAVWSLQMLEYYGFCGIGEGGPFLAEGHTRPGGDVPLNTNGGQLSESYAWGWMHLVEAVRQLRGEAGERQVRGVGMAMYCSSQAFSKAACSILSNSRDA